jgi:hypothetical protein
MLITQVNPYLDGNFAPVREEITAETLPVIGELPPDLSGMFLRNGPNPQWSPIGQYHWFDGDGMIHGVRIHNGQASFGIICSLFKLYNNTEKKTLKPLLSKTFSELALNCSFSSIGPTLKGDCYKTLHRVKFYTYLLLTPVFIKLAIFFAANYSYCS